MEQLRAKEYLPQTKVDDELPYFTMIYKTTVDPETLTLAELGPETKTPERSTITWTQQVIGLLYGGKESIFHCELMIERDCKGKGESGCCEYVRNANNYKPNKKKPAECGSGIRHKLSFLAAQGVGAVYRVDRSYAKYTGCYRKVPVADNEQLDRIFQYLWTQVIDGSEYNDGGYRFMALFDLWCCRPLKQYNVMTCDFETLKKEEEPQKRPRWFCSELVMAALVYGKVLENPSKVSPTPAGVFEALESRSEHTLHGSITDKMKYIVPPEGEYKTN